MSRFLTCHVTDWILTRYLHKSSKLIQKEIQKGIQNRMWVLHAKSTLKQVALIFTLNTFVVFGSQGQNLMKTNFNLLFPVNSVTDTTLKYIYAALVGYCGMDAKKRKAMSHLKFGARLNISAYNTSPTCTITKAAYSYLIFEAVNVRGFWGPALNGGDQKNKINVVPSIFMKFWSRNNVNQLDRLTP